MNLVLTLFSCSDKLVVNHSFACCGFPGPFLLTDARFCFRYVRELDEAKAKVEKAEKEGSPNLESLKKALAQIQSKTEDSKKQWAEFEKKEKVIGMIEQARWHVSS